MRTFRAWIALIIVAVLGAVTWTACDASGPPTGDTGTVRVRLTDAPGNITEANVTIRRVELVPGNDNGDPLVLSDEERTIDLTRLQDGVTETLANTSVPEGTYRQLRLIIDEAANIELGDGTTKTLILPSGEQTGIKILVPAFTIASESDVVEVTLDFSVEDSFVKAGASGAYVFKPTVGVQRLSVNGEAVALFEAQGAVSGVDTDARTLSVDGITFSVPDTVEPEDAEDNAIRLGDLAGGQFVEVEGTAQEEGTLLAREIEMQESGAQEREIEAALDAVDGAARTVTLLGAPFEVNDATEFDDVSRLDDLQAGDRVEVTYDVVDNALVALEIEHDEAG